MRFDVLTLFPELFSGYVSQSILKLAIERGLVQVHLWNIRDWATGKHKSVDDKPFGGGPGMVMMCGPVFDCVDAVQAQDEPGELIMLTPAGERLTQRVVEELATKKRLLLLSGRYEGFDERIRLGLKPREISAGDFVCNGGEVPAMLVIDTVIRLIPGVLGDEESTVDESHSEDGRLEYPQYTRPREFRGMTVPEVLLSGDHGAVARWRKEQSEAKPRAAWGSVVMKNSIIALIEKQQSTKAGELNKKQSELIKQPTERTVPTIQVGDTVDVYFWIELGEKGRTQVFNGTVIAIKGEKPDEFITVRRIVQGEGVERVFPLLSPRIAKIDVKKTGTVRRAKLYYLRKRVGKSTRLKERKKGEAETASRHAKPEAK